MKKNMMVKKTCIATALAIMAFGSANASVNLSQSQFRALLPDGSNYELNLGDMTTVSYHCDIKEEGTDYVLDRNKCDQRYIDFKGNYPNVVALNLLDKPSTQMIAEHKLWAMSFAHAAMNSLVLMQYSLNKQNGTFDLQKNFAATNEPFGRYFMKNMGPNYYLSKALQESSLGNDLPNNPMGVGDDDGVLQVEYPGSAWSELQGAGSGGFPAVFASMNPERTLSSNNGPARNVLGSAATSAYYNASVMGINTGSLEWHQNPEGQASSQNRIHEFIQDAKDPDALAIMLSFMYNRGPYAAKDQPLRDEATFNHCKNSTDLVNDWSCFTRQNDFGSRYIRQIPDVTKQLNAAHYFYDEKLTWNDVTAYFTLLEGYGFYSSEDISKITAAAKTVFDNNQSDGAISYKTQFGKIIEAVLTSAPIKTFAEKGDGGGLDGKVMPVFTGAEISANSMYMVAQTGNGVAFNNWLTPNAHVPLPSDASIIKLQYKGLDCTDQMESAFKDAVSHLNPNAPTQLTIHSDGQTCSFNEEKYVEPSGPAECKEGEWCATTTYTQPCTTVEYNGKKYQNQWYADPGITPDPATAEGYDSVWRFPGVPSNSCQ